MADFSDLLKRGRKMFDIKNKGGKWDKCEECGERRLCFEYCDDKEEIWFLCEDCSSIFVKEEEEE